ncbi:2-phospho-L-lactate transferase [Rubrobacter indicoceani]|uniref:2-phospho-L-lactate transferase n=1 Tax=Rubrobacter indicoceani TaxID=2051957 RepID=UPI001F098892|nr:2-phospho-L-lactate transferase [Rubrobacter indicoceani]
MPEEGGITEFEGLRVVAVAGGVGGAKMAAGLEGVSGGEGLSVVVNTADDFELWGLHISPDVDTVMYTLAGLANPETGWGIRSETFAALEMISAYGEKPWFRLGDRDFATHILRTERLRSGESLTGVTASLGAALGVRSRVLPMTDAPVATVIETPEGKLNFQDYFVGRGQRDEVIGVEFLGMGEARPTREVLKAVREAEAIVLCPSNPVVSVGPVLELAGMREAISGLRAPKVAVSPIVGGRALKGPAGKMLASLGHEASAAGVARMYAGLVDGFVVDHADAGGRREIESLGLEVLVTDAVMKDEGDRVRLGREVLEFAVGLSGRAG